MSTKYRYILKDGTSLECSEEDLKQAGIPEEDITRKEPVYEETPDPPPKLTQEDVNELLDKA